MLVCNISLRPPRRAIAAELAEAITAADELATGTVVFATLVDDPASVGEIVDAYLGEIMLEAASASDVVTSPMVYATTIVEAVTAADAQDATSGAPVTTTYTTPGASSTTVPVGQGTLVAETWGGGGAGAGGIDPLGDGGAGGGYSKKTLSVTAGSTVYFTVGAGVIGTNSGQANAGGDSWVNISSNAAPTSGSQGCIGRGGNSSNNGRPTGGVGAFGDTNFTGGTGGASTSPTGGGGGAGAGSTANGNSTTNTIGAAGGTDSGAGGNGASGTAIPGVAGTQPGGGGGGSWAGTGGSGGHGQVRLTFST